jgi:hypothetical protein
MRFIFYTFDKNQIEMSTKNENDLIKKKNSRDERRSRSLNKSR